MTALRTTTTPPTSDRSLVPAERAALAVAAVGAAAFGAYGAATGASGTTAYVAVVAAVAVTLVLLRRRPLPGVLALALAAVAVAHLAGGLVQVGDGVLYNASYGTKVLQYDHLVHAAAVFVGTLTVWTVFAGRIGTTAASPTVVVWVLAGLGLGALNELVEFLATLAHGGSGVGGYRNTGWDLVSNLLGAGAAGLVLARRPEGRRSWSSARRAAPEPQVGP